MSDPPVAFVVGCARSGTSILGELIAAHPRVTYIFEAHHVWETAGLGMNDSHRLVAADATPPVRARLREWVHGQGLPDTLVVEKTPRNVLRIPFLKAIFPDARIIHIVRDGRDVACSLMPGVGGTEWHHLKPPSWQHLMSAATGVVRCALAWKEIVEIALDDLQLVPHLQVRFEELVTRPREEARTVMRYLGLPDRPEVVNFCEKIQDGTRGSYHARHQTLWYREDHQRRVGRWRENLTREEQRAVIDALRPLLHRLGYESPAAPGRGPRARRALHWPAAVKLWHYLRGKIET